MTTDDKAGAISREWGAYMIKPRFSEAAALEGGEPWPEKSADEIRAHKDRILKRYESHIHVLPTPIIVDLNSVQAILTLKSGDKTVRVYPPFPIDEKGETSGALSEVMVPEGHYSVASHRPLPRDAVKGVRVEQNLGSNTKWCRGLRLDVESGANESRVIRLLMNQICQYTHQWWLRATHNPFVGPFRMGGAIANDFSIVETFRYKGGSSLESSWYGAVQSQSNLGIGAALTQQIWLLASTHVSDERDADTGILSFHDGFASYMAGEDEKCILNLAIAVEIMLHKHMAFSEGRTSNDSFEKLLRRTRLIDDGIKERLKSLLIDRGHVAHGRKPYLLNRKPDCTIENYIAVVRQVISAYLASIPTGKWPNIMTMAIERS